MIKEFLFEDTVQLANFVRDCIINILAQKYEIDTVALTATLILAPPGIDRIDSTALLYGGRRV